MIEAWLLKVHVRIFDLIGFVVFNSNQDILGHVTAKLLIADSSYRIIMRTSYQLVGA